MASSLVMGLDLGNTSCSVAVYRQGAVDVIANEQGSRTTPSCIAFTEVETLLGESARSQLVRNKENTIVDGLRLLGREYDDEDFQSEMASWRFNVTKGKDGAPQVNVQLKGEAKSFAAPRLLSLLFGRLRADADAWANEPMKEAVVAVPADFSERQREALKEAAQIGAIRVKLMLPAPLCVALLYGRTVGAGAGAAAATASAAAAETPAAAAAAAEGHPSPSVPPAPTAAPTAAPRPQQLLVVDVGGSSSYAAVVERILPSPSVAATGAVPGAEGAGDGVRTASDVYAIRSCVVERGLGGNNVDVLLRAHVVKEIRRRQRIDLSDNARAMSRLLSACQVAKHSTMPQATITVEADGADYVATVSRATMEDLTGSTAMGAAALGARALAGAGLDASRVDAVLLAGGGARMPRVQAALAALCPASPMHFGGTAEESVVRGAAHAGAMLKPMVAPDSPGEERVVSLCARRRLPRALGLVAEGGTVVPLVEVRAAVPLERSVRLAPPDATSLPVLLTLVEMALPPVPAADGAAAADGGASEAAAAAQPVAASACRVVASLALRALPEKTEALVVKLRIDAEKRVELVCEALVGGEAQAVASVIA